MTLPPMALISAHQCGAGPGLDYARFGAALRGALDIECEYVEFDVQVTGDRRFICYHDNAVRVAWRSRPVPQTPLADLAAAIPGLVMYDEALGLLRGRKKAHLDLKFDQAPTPVDPDVYVAAARLAVDVLGADNVLITTGRLGVAAVREWSRRGAPDLLVACAMGLSWPGFAATGRLGRLLGADSFMRTVLACDATLVAATPALARRGLADWTGRTGLPLLVWTVDSTRQLRRLFSDPRVSIVTTNRPAAAAAIRRCG